MSARTTEIATARAADERIAAAWAAYWAKIDEAAPFHNTITDSRRRLRSPRPMSEESIARHHARIEDAQAKIKIVEIDAAPLREAAQALDAELYTGWSRFYLVQHIHNTAHCSSFRPTTRVGWLPAVSGLTEREAVAEYGATLCTICFPTAPVELTTPQLDPSLCAGSGAFYDEERKTGREGAYYSPSGTCPVCGKAIGLSSRGSRKIRKHKAVGA